MESCNGGEGEEEVVGEGEDENDEGEKEREDMGDEDNGDEETFDGVSRSLGDGHTHPFILPKIWIVNNFMPMMSTKVFNTLQDHYQIPDHILIRLPRKFGKCYSGRTANVGMYDAMFVAGLRLPLTALHRQLANFLGLSISQVAPNAWRIFIGAEIL